MCKVEGSLLNGPPTKVDCGHCSCKLSSVPHIPDGKGRCSVCRQYIK